MNFVVFDIGIMLCLFFILIVMEWKGGEWMMGVVMCKLVNLSLIMFYFVIINIFVVIVVYCFLVVVFLFKLKVGKFKIVLVILLMWFIVFFCVLFLFGV